MEYIIDIERRNNEGEGVGKIDNIVSFVPNSLEKEKVKVRINKKEKNFYLCDNIEIIEKSENRVEPLCKYYSECGGCNIMHENYNSQLNFKKQKVKQILKKICNLDIELDIISSNKLNYRNKVTLKVEKDKIGFYKNKTNQIVEIDKCLLVESNINEIIEKLRNFIKINKDNEMEEVVIRSFENNNMIVLDHLNDNLKKAFIDLFKNECIYVNNECINLNNQIIQKQNNLSFLVSPKSFFQVNKNVSEKMYEYVNDNIDENDNVLDLYSGTGTISLIVSKKAKKVYGIEVVKDAVMDAIENSKINKIENVEFICGKVQDKIDLIKEKNIDIVILDPPRSGSDRKSLNTILDIKPKKIIYISCNPVTLARDYNILNEYYEIKKIQAFDMFPQTYHVETVMILEKKDV